jgi:rhamnulokinase
MSHTANLLAADFGASSGRVMVGRWNGRSFSLDELHRFPNAGVSLGSSVYWDALGIWSHFEAGLRRYKPRFDDPPLGAVPTLESPRPVAPGVVLLIASGDLRQSA